MEEPLGVEVEAFVGESVEQVADEVRRRDTGENCGKGLDGDCLRTEGRKLDTESGDELAVGADGVGLGVVDFECFGDEQSL